MFTRASALAIAALGLVGCTAESATRPIAGLPYAAALPACGPADGPAVEVRLQSTSHLGAGEPPAPFVRVLINHSLSALPAARWVLGGEHGFASYLPVTGSGEGLTSGVVTITSVDASSTVSGVVDLVFARAGRVTGRFVAAWVPRTMLCG